jgi:hypothetical protein
VLVDAGLSPRLLAPPLVNRRHTLCGSTAGFMWLDGGLCLGKARRLRSDDLQTERPSR